MHARGIGSVPEAKQILGAGDLIRFFEFGYTLSAAARACFRRLFLEEEGEEEEDEEEESSSLLLSLDEDECRFFLRFLFFFSFSLRFFSSFRRRFLFSLRLSFSSLPSSDLASGDACDVLCAPPSPSSISARKFQQFHELTFAFQVFDCVF
jgi:hypothetical protein